MKRPNIIQISLNDQHDGVFQVLSL